MKITISYDTALAVQNCQLLTEALRVQQASFRTAGETADDAAAAVKGYAAAAKEAASAAGQHTTAARDESDAMGRLKDATNEETNAARQGVSVTVNLLTVLQQLNQQVNANTTNVQSNTNTLNQHNTTINNTAASTTAAGNSAADSAGKVTDWLGRYVRVMAAIQVLEKMRDVLKEINEAEKELADRQAATLKDNSALSVRFGLNDRQANAVVGNVTTVAGSSRETARAALMAAGEAGVDPTRRGSAGEGVAIELAKAGTMYGLGQSELKQIAQAANASGNGSGAGVDALLGKLVAAMPRGTDPKEFINAAMGNLLPELERGGNLDSTLATFSTIYGKTRNASAAATAVKQLRTLAERGSKSEESFFAERAAAAGILQVPAVTRSEAERMADSQATRPEDRIADQRQRIESDRQKVADDELALQRRKEKLSADELRFKMVKPKERDAARMRIEADKDAIDRDGRSIGVDRLQVDRHLRDLEQSLAKLASDETAKRQLAAFGAMSPTDRLQRVIVPVVSGAKTDAERKAIADALSVRQGDAVFGLASAGPGGYGAALAAVSGAGAGNFQAAANQFGRGDYAKDIRNQATIEADSAAAAGPGTALARRALELAMNQRDVDAKNGGPSFDLKTFKGATTAITMSKDEGVNDHFALNLAEAANQAATEAADTGDQLTQARLLGIRRDILKDYSDSVGGRTSFTTDVGRAQLNSYAEAIGAAKDSITPGTTARKGAAVRAASKPAQRQTAPPAQPIGPQASAGDVHHHVTNVHNYYNNTTSIGAYYPAAFDGDLPGPLEQTII